MTERQPRHIKLDRDEPPPPARRTAVPAAPASTATRHTVKPLTEAPDAAVADAAPRNGVTVDPRPYGGG